MALRILWLDQPVGSLIFDEKYYVNVARIILGLPHEPDVYVGALPGKDPNAEHPPLAKLFIAFSMSLFGDNAYGWRIPSLVFGGLTLFLFYLLIKRVSGSRPIALISAYLLSFDNLTFVHSRIATLDIFTLAFMVLSFFWYFGRHYRLSAVTMAVATLTKLGGLYGFLALVGFHVVANLRNWQSEESWLKILNWLERYALVYGVAFVAGLTVLDRFWGAFSNPFEHINHMYTYTFALVRDRPTGIESYPWQWLINEVKIPYLSVNINVIVNNVVTETRSKITFWGAMNPVILYLTIPTFLYELVDYYKSRGQFQLFLLAWFVLTYLPFYPLSILSHRIMYIHYFLNTVPAVSAGVSHMIVDQRLPLIVVLLYMGAVIAGYGMLFPFRAVP